LKKLFIVNSDYHETRIDRWLKNNFSTLNQSFIEKNLRKGNIKVNDSKIEAKYKLLHKDKIIIFNYSEEIYSHVAKLSNKTIIPKKYLELFNSSIIFENKDFLILNKWTGIATQEGSKINISIDHIIKHFSDKYNLVHRLDRETSGLLIIAKNRQSTKFFGKLFKEHKISKVYLAICHGHPKNPESEINLSIAAKNKNNKRSNSITRYKVLQTKNKLSKILFAPKTGKTHQIRIVSQHLGCPIVGDTKYNKQNKYNFEKLKLNAHMLQFYMNDNKYEFTSKLPTDFLNFFRNNNLKLVSGKELKIFLNIA
jgi:23S rRNA pseudouridine955/2504/2580 synthase